MQTLVPIASESASVMVVDDDPRMRSALEAEFEDMDISSSLFDNAFDLLRAFCDHQPPSCIFLDLILPQMNGIECAKQLRSLGYTNPIIIFSALYDPEMRQKALDSGANDYLLKADFFKNLPLILQRNT